MVDFRGLDFTGAANPQLAVFFLCALQKCFHVSNHKIFTIISFEEKKTYSFISHIPEVALDVFLIRFVSIQTTPNR